MYACSQYQEKGTLQSWVSSKISQSWRAFTKTPGPCWDPSSNRAQNWEAHFLLRCHPIERFFYHIRLVPIAKGGLRSPNFKKMLLFCVLLGSLPFFFLLVGPHSTNLCQKCSPNFSFDINLFKCLLWLGIIKRIHIVRNNKNTRIV